MTKQLRIAILGGGPGGLTLARILHINGVRATVFEREAFSAARPQGGSLDMHAETGQYAIEQAGLSVEFKRIARYEDQESRVYDKHGVLRFLDEEVAGKERPETDRGQLRAMLMESLPPSVIRWGHEVSAATPQEGGTFEVAFRNGARESFDLIVGADGAWSRVRPLVSDAKPVYSGVMFVELGIDAADARYPELARRVGRGMMFALGDSKALISHRDANAHLGVYAAMRVPEDWVQTSGLDWSSNEAMRRSLMAYFSDWSGELLELIANAGVGGERIVPRPIYALPVGHRWEHREGVTLLGDAAHLMSPFGGNGANLAMRDATDLALALIGDGDWKAAVREYETTMFARAAEAAAEARDGIDEVFSEDGLAHILRHMEERLG